MIGIAGATQIADIPQFVAVEIHLIRIGGAHAVVTGVKHPVLVAILGFGNSRIGANSVFTGAYIGGLRARGPRPPGSVGSAGSAVYFDAVFVHLSQSAPSRDRKSGV